MTGTTMREFFTVERFARALPLLRRRMDLADAYQKTFETPHGKIVLRDLIQEGGVLETARDPTDSRFYDGKRALALHVLERLRWSASELQQLGQAVTYEQLLQQESHLAGEPT